MNTDRIEAAIRAEAKRIQAWNWSRRTPEGLPATPIPNPDILVLANHLVRNRLQAEDANLRALVAAVFRYKTALRAAYKANFWQAPVEGADAIRELEAAQTALDAALAAAGEEA